MQIVIDELVNDEWISSIGEITLENDSEGRIYIRFDHGRSEIGINLPDILKFINEQMVRP